MPRRFSGKSVRTNCSKKESSIVRGMESNGQERNQSSQRDSMEGGGATCSVSSEQLPSRRSRTSGRRILQSTVSERFIEDKLRQSISFASRSTLKESVESAGLVS